MGYYIPNDKKMSQRDASLISRPATLEDVPEDKALICQVDNFVFFANALIYNKREFDDFNEPSDSRPKKWYLMDKEDAHKLSGYQS